MGEQVSVRREFRRVVDSQAEADRLNRLLDAAFENVRPVQPAMRSSARQSHTHNAMDWMIAELEVAKCVELLLYG